MTTKQEKADEFVAEVTSLAVAIDDLMVGHYEVVGLMAIGWVVGAYAAGRGPEEKGLNLALEIVGREAKRKFDGVLDGSWGSPQ